MTMKDRKQAVLNEIMTAYENYQGRKSKLENQLRDLKHNGKLTAEDCDRLLAALTADRQYTFGVLANSWRVRVSLDGNAPTPKRKLDNGKNYPFEDLDKLLEEDLGDLE